MNSNPPCSRCGSDQWKGGKNRGVQRYQCQTIWRHESPPVAIDCTTPGRCPYCDGRTHRRGTSKGRQYYHCNLCRHGSYGPIDPNRKTKPRPVTVACTTPGQCPYCNGRTKKDGLGRGEQRYQCTACGRYCTGGWVVPKPPPPIMKTPGQCPYCMGRTVKDGTRRGKQRYICTACGRKCTGGRVEPKPSLPAPPPSLETIARRREQAAQLGAALLPMIRAALPSYLLPDVAEDITQEMAVDALDAAFDLSDLLAMVPIYRRRINRLSSHTARFISIDAIIPGTNHLTYAETLIG